MLWTAQLLEQPDGALKLHSSVSVMLSMLHSHGSDIQLVMGLASIFVQ